MKLDEMIDNNYINMIVLVGPPASGKSTLARTYVEQGFYVL